MDDYTKNGRSGRVRVQAPICDRQTVTELSSDFTLPDYQPEIKRLLRIRAVVTRVDKYIGVGSAEFSGAVDYGILYSASDGGLYCANENCEFQFSVPIEMASDFELNEGLVCDAEIRPETVSGRVASPRKISVKCRLRTRVRLFGTKLLEEDIGGAPADTVERLCGSAECARLFVGGTETLQLGDEILCDPQAGDLRVINAEGQVFVAEATAGSGAVNCRGEVCLKLLCCIESNDALPTVQLRRIPFHAAIPTDGAEVNCECCAEGVCSDLHVTVEEGRIVCEVSAHLQAYAQRNESVTFTRDLYSTAAEGECRYTSCVFSKSLGCVNGNFSLNTAISLEEAGIPAGAALIDLSVTPTVSSLECERGKYYLLGKCRCQAVLREGDETVTQEFELPFRYETDQACDDGAPVTDYRATVEAISCRARMDSERIGVDAELAVSMLLRGESRFDMLAEAHFSETDSDAGAVYTICYPSREDTLWSVAKRYRRSVGAVSELNSLAGSPAADAPDSLMGVKYLIV